MILLLILLSTGIAAIARFLSGPRVGPQGGASPPATPILDRVLGNPLPASHPSPNGGIEPDAGAP